MLYKPPRTQKFQDSRKHCGFVKVCGGGFGGAKGAVFSYSRKTYYGNFKEPQRNESSNHETYTYKVKKTSDVNTSYNVV